jgi:hypothetical protein
MMKQIDYLAENADRRQVSFWGSAVRDNGDGA